MYSQLKSGQVFHKGDYLADNGTHHIKNTIHSADELNALIVKNLKETDYRYIFYIGLKNVKIRSTDLEKDLYCNIAIPSNSSQNTEEDKDRVTIRRANGDGWVYIFIPKSYFTATTVSEIKQEFLNKLEKQGIPLTIEYDLKEEIIEPYNEAQQKAYEQIKNAKSYKGTTHIFSEDEIKPILEVEAFADTSNSINTKEKITEEIKEEESEE